MSHNILSRADLDFLLNDWLHVDDLLVRPEYDMHSTDTVAASLDLAEELAQRWFVPANRVADSDEPELTNGQVRLPASTKAAWDAFAASGLGAAGFPEKHGGGQLPLVVSRACFAWFQAASIAVSAYPMLTTANANLLLAHGTPDQIERFARPMIEGRWAGTMCLSEPQAGSSLADITTRASLDPEGRYRLFGNKMWISAGDHELADNILHLVLARTGPPELGVKGLSLFAVPKWIENDGTQERERNDVCVTGVNHKMGYRGTVNTVLSFGDGAHEPGGEPGALGELIGAEGTGLFAMFHMMNEARIAVGTGAAALAVTSYLHAVDYARQRTQGRLIGSRDSSTPPVAIIKHPDVRRMLLAAKSYAEGGLALCLYAARLVDDIETAGDGSEQQDAQKLLDVLTPIVKTWPSEYGLAANDIAIQVLGGYGYTRDYPVEQFYRDNRLNPIHEGTTGIQANDLLGRKVRGDRGAGLQLLLDRIRATVRRSERDASWAWAGAELGDVVGRLEVVTDSLIAEEDDAVALADAVLYLEAAGHLVVAWIWLDIALTATQGDSPLHKGKQQAAKYFISRELPLVGTKLQVLGTTHRDRTVLDTDPSWL